MRLRTITCYDGDGNSALRCYQCTRCSALVPYDSEGADAAEHEAFHEQVDRITTALARLVEKDNLAELRKRPIVRSEP